jgi:hypothetical protein
MFDQSQIDITKCPKVLNYLKKRFSFLEISEKEWVKFLGAENYFPKITVGELYKKLTTLISEQDFWKLVKKSIVLIESGLTGHDMGIKERTNLFFENLHKLIKFNVDTNSTK